MTAPQPAHRCEVCGEVQTAHFKGICPPRRPVLQDCPKHPGSGFKDDCLYCDNEAGRLTTVEDIINERDSLRRENATLQERLDAVRSRGKVLLGEFGYCVDCGEELSAVAPELNELLTHKTNCIFAPGAPDTGRQA